MNLSFYKMGYVYTNSHNVQQLTHIMCDSCCTLCEPIVAAFVRQSISYIEKHNYDNQICREKA